MANPRDFKSRSTPPLSKHKRLLMGRAKSWSAWLGQGPGTDPPWHRLKSEYAPPFSASEAGRNLGTGHRGKSGVRKCQNSFWGNPVSGVRTAFRHLRMNPGRVRPVPPAEFEAHPPLPSFPGAMSPDSRILPARGRGRGDEAERDGGSLGFSFGRGGRRMPPSLRPLAGKAVYSQPFRKRLPNQAFRPWFAWGPRRDRGTRASEPRGLAERHHAATGQSKCGERRPRR
jgi:hypothetical protein